MRTKLSKMLFIALMGVFTTQVSGQEFEPDSLSVDREELKEVVIVGRGVIDIEEDRKTPVAVSTILKTEIQEKAQGNVEFPEVLANTPSVYVSNQAGGFGDSQMFTRGFDQTNTAFLLNGQPINGMEDGRMYWSNWSGMTEIANAVQIQRGLGSSKLAISSVGGTINIITRATEKKQGGYAQAIVGNDSYIKGAIGYNTGLMNSGWAFSVALSHWQANRKYATGTAGAGQNYFISLGKKINEKNNVNFLITGAPQWHDQNFSKTMAVYDLRGEKYNNNYGFYDNGDYLSLRRNYYHKPVMNLNWDWEINEKSNLSTVLYASFGRGGGTGNYGSLSGSITRADGRFNWSAIEALNGAVVGPNQVVGGQTLPSGFSGNNIGYFYFNDLADANNNGNQLRQRNGYIVRSSVNNHSWYGGVTNYNMEVNENFSFNVGADVRFYKGDHFRQVVDYLGLDGYYDQQGFSQRGIVTQNFDANPWSALFDFASEDQRINYDNSEWINYQGLFGQAEYKTDRVSLFVQGSTSNQSYQKEDRYNFDSAKKGDKISKMGYNLKGGIAFFIDDENSIYGNSGMYSRQPFLDNIYQGYVFDATKTIEPEIDNEEITGFEFGYRFKSKTVNVNVNLYYTTWDNRSVVSTGVNNNGTPTDTTDDIDLLIQELGLKQEHKGVEIDFNTKVTQDFNLRGYFSYGDWNRVDGYTRKTFNNENNTLISEQVITLTKDEKITQAPQTSFGLGVAYKIAKYLSFDCDFNYYARNFDRFVNNNSEMLDPYALINAGVTSKFKLGTQKLKVRANVYNVFNSSYVSQSDAFGYFLGLGRTWNASIGYEF